MQGQNPSFSARYYPSAPLRNHNSDLSIWLSVDPLSDKYPNLSPYTYCAGNPVRLVDPDGMTFFEVEGEKKHIDDGRDNITIHKTSKKQFEKLSNAFDNSNKNRYNRLYNRYKKHNGYTENTTSGIESLDANGKVWLKTLTCTYKSGEPYFSEKVGKVIRKIDEGGHGDYFDRKFAEAVDPYITSTVLFLPPVSIINNVSTLTTGYDIYGEQADCVDYMLSGVGIVAVPMSFMKNAVGKGAKWADEISTLFTSGYTLYKRKTNNEKD